MKKLIYTLLVVAIGQVAFAQTNSWKYDFGETESTFNPNPGASSTKFLPKGAVNLNKGLKQVVRVRTSSDATGAFGLVKKGASFIKGAGLEIIAGSSTSKFSIYNIDSKAVARTSLMKLLLVNGFLPMAIPISMMMFFREIQLSKKHQQKYSQV